MRFAACAPIANAGLNSDSSVDVLQQRLWIKFERVCGGGVVRVEPEKSLVQFPINAYGTNRCPCSCTQMVYLGLFQQAEYLRDDGAFGTFGLFVRGVQALTQLRHTAQIGHYVHKHLQG